MTSFITGAFQLRNRLKKTLPSVALAATALVGGASVLSGGQAKAFNCTFNNTTAPTSGSCTNYTDWIDSNPVASDKQIKFVKLPDAGGGNIEFKWINFPPGMNDEWHVDVDFDPDLLPLPADGPSMFDYLIRIKPGFHNVFKDVSLGAVLTGDSWVTKEVWATDGNGNKFGNDPLAILDTRDANPDSYTFLSGYKELYISDLATPVNGAVDAYQNSFRQVPGPLPLVGAGAAFGFTRKLRRRVKAFRMA